VVARIAADSSAGVPSLSVLAANGTVVANGSATATGREAVDTVPSNGTYYVRVAGTGGTTASYDLTVRVPTAVTVAPEPQSITARPGGNVTVDVVANGAASGVSAYDVSLATNASLATVASVDPAGAAGAGDVSVAPDGSSATLDAANLSLSASSGATTLATVTLDATNATGEDALRVTASSVVDADGVDYAVEASNGTLRVSAGPGDVGGSGGAATDPLPTRPGYEDVDGDGDFDFFDVVTFLFALDELPAETRQFFDFDADGETDFFDVISLLFRT
jgi:hypothetical protein